MPSLAQLRLDTESFQETQTSQVNTPASPLAKRIRALGGLLGRLEPYTPISCTQRAANSAVGAASGNRLPSLPCTSYLELVEAWQGAMRWRGEMDDVLSAMLAVALSTEQVGDQLFLTVWGDAGSGKTRFCDAMLVSRYCYAIEQLTGLYSGKNDGSGEDYSLINRINKMTLITPEADVLNTPKFQEIMSQVRRIFDGKGRASYKNRLEDLNYEGLRTPWIIAGTPESLTWDQSRLGDRFLKVYWNQPDEEEKAAILSRVAYTALMSVRQTSDGTPTTHLEPKMCEAYQRTGGYVDHLRSNAAELLSQVHMEEYWLDYCTKLAELVSYLRARPKEEQKEAEASKEMPTRLTSQFTRLAVCLAAVLQRPQVDTEVMRRVRKVAFDTGRGHVYQILNTLRKAEYGLEETGISIVTGKQPERNRIMLRFLRQIGAIELREKKIMNPDTKRLNTTKRYYLNQALIELFRAADYYHGSPT